MQTPTPYIPNAHRYSEGDLAKMQKRAQNRLMEIARRANEHDTLPPICEVRFKTTVERSADAYQNMPRMHYRVGKDYSKPKREKRERPERKRQIRKKNLTVVDVLSGRTWPRPTDFAFEYQMNQAGIVSLLRRNAKGAAFKAKHKFELWYMEDAIAAGRISPEWKYNSAAGNQAEKSTTEG